MLKRLCSLALTVVFAIAARAELPAISDPANDPAWRDLVVKLGADKSRFSTFEERRYFSFRKTPVVLTGEIRLDPEHGISLRYLTPEARVVIIDRQGMLMRDARGDHPVPDDHRARAATSQLVDVLRFNLPALQKTFAVRGQQEGDAWTLAFSPRDPALAKTLGSLVVTGEKALVRKIEMTLSSSQRIEIIVGETQEDVIFTGSVLAGFFR